MRFHKMPADMARCASKACPQREQCLRAMSPPQGKGYRQSYICPNRDEETGVCANQIEILPSDYRKEEGDA